MEAGRHFRSVWRSQKGGSLHRRMMMMLLAIVLQSLLLVGIVSLAGLAYMRGFNAVMDECYRINELQDAFLLETESFRDYALDRSETAYAAYLESRSGSNAALAALDVSIGESTEQYLLLQAVRQTNASFRKACDEMMLRLVAGQDAADVYERALGAGQYIEQYIRQLLQVAIGEGQALYQRNMSGFRVLQVLFPVFLLLSLLSIMQWTRWTIRRVVQPLNRLIEATDEMSENHYDAPDLAIDETDEIAQLSQVVNKMKHSTARLVESLRTQQEIGERLHAEELRRVTLEKTMDSLRLSLLQSQINPHFLFNTLNIISRMAQLEEAPKTEDLIKRLSNLFRHNLQSVEDVVPLSEELRIVHDYIAIQQIRFGERVTFSLHCDIDPSDYRVPVFTMQPLIENAVIHGIGPVEEGGEIAVCISAGDGMLRITVSDTGVGMTEAMVSALLTGEAAEGSHVAGIGIGNVRRRLLARFPGSGFVISSRPQQGTCVTITIPLEAARGE